MSAISDPRDAQIATLQKEVAYWKQLAFSPLGDNHHNALLCPHCNPNGLVLAIPVKPGESDPVEKTKAAIN